MWLIPMLQVLTMEADQSDCANSTSELQLAWTLSSVSATSSADASYRIDTTELLPLSLHVTPDPHILVLPASALHVRRKSLRRLPSLVFELGLLTCRG